jgi:hypothetical protein
MVSLRFSAPYAISTVRAKPLFQGSQHLGSSRLAADDRQASGTIASRRLAAGAFTSTMLLDKFAFSQ